MGLLVDRDSFENHEYARFSERLIESLAALERTLERPGFGEGPQTIGAELELHLVDAAGYAVPDNLGVLERCRDRRLTVEIDRFNIELNLTPVPLSGRPFEALARELNEAIACVHGASGTLGIRTVAVGILPTLRPEDVGPSALTPLPRYRALDAGIRHSRGGVPFRIAIGGEDVLQTEWETVTLEGANTSLQFHLRVPPSRFAEVYNAAQIATAPVLAVSANSPFLLGKRLWDETRVAVFRQATDDRGDLPPNWTPPARVSFGRGWVRRGAWELFAESVALHTPLIPVLGPSSPMEAVRRGEVPRLDELRLHNGTIWNWNRPVYDPGYGGHLRIEFRALPAGPTPIDMMANGAFILGLTLALAPRVESMLPGLPFRLARENFHRAARDGIDADMLWPERTAPSPRPVKVIDLLPQLIELADEGLRGAGVDPVEISRLLGLIRDRAAARMTGARWQRQTLAAYEVNLSREDALSRMLHRYIELSDEGRPVHEWPVG